MQNSRRLFLAGGGLTALAAVTAAPARASVSTEEEVRRQTTIRFASEFGTVGDGAADDTAALQEAINWSSDALGTLLLDAGFYAINALSVKPQARIVGAGAGHTFYPRAKQPRMAGAVIVPRTRDATTEALVTIPVGSTGVQLQNLAIDGYNFRWGGDAADPALRVRRVGLDVRGGVEVVVNGVRVVRFAATGIAIERLNNARWTDVFVDRSGSDDEPAFVLRSPADGASNFIVFDGLTIERSANTALSIAVGDDPVRDWASNVTFIGLHVESNRDYGEHSFPINTKPLIDVGNVRALTFVAPQVLGGAAPMLRYRQTIPTEPLGSAPGGDARDQQGGMTVLGGHFDAHGGGTVARAGIEVSGLGRGASLRSVRFASLPAVPAVLIGQDYGFDLHVSGCSQRWAKELGRPVQDDRPDAVRRHWPSRVQGDQVIGGGGLLIEGRQFRVADRSPADATKAESVDASSISAGWVEVGARGPGTDTAGRLFVYNWKPVRGPLVRVTFERAIPAQPIVMVTARNERAATARLFVRLDEEDGRTLGFTVCTADELDRSTEAMFVDYFVVGRVPL
ncbi:hypothetical protein [Curtobacterium pusillum]|uniref:hypothetical protein n=1 Tax=Curtobacterium pusillum TaxID=69373 RepID=UPI0011A1284D|nr:hypothetical protein [Curtobacterium pusillum]